MGLKIQLDWCHKREIWTQRHTGKTPCDNGGETGVMQTKGWGQGLRATLSILGRGSSRAFREREYGPADTDFGPLVSGTTRE